MPFYDFTCKNPESPNHKIPKTIHFKSMREHDEKKDSIYCEVTGDKMEQTIGTPIFNLKGEGFYKGGNNQ